MDKVTISTMPHYHVVCTCGETIPRQAVEAVSAQEASRKLLKEIQVHWSKKHRDEEPELMPEVEDMLEEAS